MSPVLHPIPNRRADILFTIAVIGGLYAAYVVRHMLLLIYVSALFAVVLSPLIQLIARIHIRKWRPGHGIALLILIVGLATVLTLFLVFALPPIFHDARSMASEWPKRLAELANRARNVPFVESIDISKIDDYIAAANACTPLVEADSHMIVAIDKVKRRGIMGTPGVYAFAYDAARNDIIFDAGASMLVLKIWSV